MAGNNPTRPRILLADDHKMVAEGLRTLLASEFDLVDVVGDGIALVDSATRHRPDVIVADIAMPGLSGLEALAILKRRDPAVKLIFLTMHRDAGYVAKARELHACGFVLKHSASEELVAAIHAVAEGRTYFSAALPQGQEADVEEALAPEVALTSRQRQILHLISEGHSAKEIGKILSISSRTVEFHKYRIMESHGLHSAAELIHFAIKHGLSPP